MLLVIDVGNTNTVLGVFAGVAVLFAAILMFIAANLAVGYTFSTIAQNQLQAMQMMVFFLLPSILLRRMVRLPLLRPT